MVLSACILTRDEPADLRRALLSLGNVADEILVVANHDTSAQTIATAEEAGARLIPIQWEKSFAAARNAGLEAARGEWVLWLDTDEELVTADRMLFRRLMSDAAALAYYVRIQDVDDSGAPVMSQRHHRSLYRRRDDIRYVGRIHEHFEPSLEDRATSMGMRIELSPVCFRHRGYTAERNPRRLQRNVALLELELRDRPGQLYYLSELGRSLLLLGDGRGHQVMADAIRLVLPHVHEARAPWPMVQAILEYVLVRADAGCPMKPGQAAELAERWFGRSPAVLWQGARWYYSQGDFARAAAMLQRVLALGQSGDFDHDLSFDQRVFGDETRLNLGVCLARLGNVAEARSCMRSIDPRGPFGPMAAANLDRLGLE